MPLAEQVALQPRSSRSTHHQQRMAIQRIEELQDRRSTQGQPADVESSRLDSGQPIKDGGDLAICPVRRGDSGRHPEPAGDERRDSHRQIAMRPTIDCCGYSLDLIEGDLIRHDGGNEVKAAQSACYQSVDPGTDTEPSEISHHPYRSHGGKQFRHFGATRTAAPRHPSEDPLEIR